jgi:hypothetical protein
MINRKGRGWKQSSPNFKYEDYPSIFLEVLRKMAGHFIQVWWSLGCKLKPGSFIPAVPKKISGFVLRHKNNFALLAAILRNE